MESTPISRGGNVFKCQTIQKTWCRITDQFIAPIILSCNKFLDQKALTEVSSDRLYSLVNSCQAMSVSPQRRGGTLWSLVPGSFLWREGVRCGLWSKVPSLVTGCRSFLGGGSPVTGPAGGGEGVAVCLLRSRRRTLLFLIYVHSLKLILIVLGCA